MRPPWHLDREGIRDSSRAALGLRRFSPADRPGRILDLIGRSCPLPQLQEITLFPPRREVDRTPAMSFHIEKSHRDQPARLRTFDPEQ
jgi:hypothetical protein